MTIVTTNYTEPKSPETICLVLGRKHFNVFLRDIHDTPGESWKAAQIELTGREVASFKFDRIEFFTDTLIGPIVAQRVAATEDVHVIMRRPTEGIYRTAESIIEAVRDGKITGRS